MTTDRYSVDVDLVARTITYGPATTGHYLRARVPTGWVVDFAQQAEAEGRFVAPLIPDVKPGDLIEWNGAHGRAIADWSWGRVHVAWHDGGSGIVDTAFVTVITRLP